VALILLTLKGYKKNEPIISLAHRRILFALIFFIFLGLSSLSFQKYEQIMDSNGRSSLHSRFMIWDSSFLMLEGSPFFGIGPGTFQKVYLDNQKYFPVPYLEWAVSEPHNTYLAFYLESGLVGFVGFLLIIFWLLKKSWRSDLVFVFLVYFLIHGMVDTLYWKNDLSFIFWIVVAVGYASAKKSLEIKSEP
jgi:O-antigen ligase